MRRAASFLAAAGMAMLSATDGRSAAYDCDGLATDLRASEVGRVLVYQANQGGWTPLEPVNSYPAGSILSLLYVTREMLDPTRTRDGVVVIKTGRILNEATSAKRPGNVNMVRPKDEFLADKCASRVDVRNFERSVSVPSYDVYHDHVDVVGIDNDDVSTIDSYHARYTGRFGDCYRTNEPTPDTIVDFRSNRTQFSFDSSVVARQLPPTVAALFIFRKAEAVKLPMTEQTVTMRRYRMAVGRSACVQFDARVTGKGSFLRVNDLEARLPGAFNFRYRVGEQTFLLQQ